MQNSNILKAILIISGFIAVAIGAFITLAPHAFHALNLISLGDDINLLSEIRAPGTGLLAIGVLIICGGFIPKLAYTASLVSTILYLAYGGSRIFSMFVDGLPISSLVQVAIIEIAIGLVNLYAFTKYKNP